DYVDAKLAQFEIALRKVLEDTQSSVRSVAKTLDQVEVGRERLRAPGTAADQALAPHDERPLETELYYEHGETDEVGRLRCLPLATSVTLRGARRRGGRRPDSGT